VLSVLVHGALAGVDTGYGTTNFVPMADDADVGEAQGSSGLKFSWAGPYYSTVSMNFNISDWNLGLVSENTVSLIPELGHAISYLAAGFGSQNSFAFDGLSNAASNQNTQNARTKCFKSVAPNDFGTKSPWPSATYPHPDGLDRGAAR